MSRQSFWSISYEITPLYRCYFFDILINANKGTDQNSDDPYVSSVCVSVTFFTMPTDYYASLGVSKTATEAEIKKAYKKKAMQYHPDKNAGDKKAEAKFKEINEAYQTLGDVTKRKNYDQFGSADGSPFG